MVEKRIFFCQPKDFIIIRAHDLTKMLSFKRQIKIQYFSDLCWKIGNNIIKLCLFLTVADSTNILKDEIKTYVKGREK